MEGYGAIFSLINTINDEELTLDNIEELRASIKAWVKPFLSIYQSKDVTPYIHAFMMHVPQFIALHGILVYLLEKLDDFSTKLFQRDQNTQLLKQMLEKCNHVENLEDSRYQRIK